jgi:hypothetical protein
MREKLLVCVLTSDAFSPEMGTE